MMVLIAQTLIVLYLVHVLYEKKILPIILLRQRHKLFALRDELRRYEITRGSEVNDQVLHLMHSSVNVAINTLDYLDVAFLYKFDRAVKQDQSLRERIERNSELFERHATEELRNIRSSMMNVLVGTVTAHSGMGAVYLLPVACFFALTGVIKMMINRFTDIPENTAYTLMPARELSASKC